jgi:ADP-ribose pyrophosphatase YjhB (NUDIX family)
VIAPSADAAAVDTTPAVAADVAVFTVLDGALHVLLVRVARGGFAGRWALPGGRVRADEALDEAAVRLLATHTGLAGVYLEQLFTFGHPQRDPHGRVVSVAYVGLVAQGGRVPGRRRGGGPAAAPDGSDVAWRPVAALPPLAYDHRTVVDTGVARLRAKLGYTNLGYTLLPPAFTLGELQGAYEAVLGRTLDRRNFRKKILALGLLRPLGRQRRGPHRPAALWAFRHRRPMVIEIL